MSELMAMATALNVAQVDPAIAVADTAYFCQQDTFSFSTVCKCVLDGPLLFLDQ